MVNQEHIGKNGRSFLREHILYVSSKWAVAEKTSRTKAWKRLENHLGEISSSGKQIHVDFSIFLKIAASFVILVLAAYLIYHQYDVTAFTKRGEHKLVTLPDHSTVLLNAASSISYNSLLFCFNRNLSFDGEGFFTITKGNQFEVRSSLGTIEVLGTQFNVKSTVNTYQVACTEGKVSVSTSQGHSNVLLTAGLSTSIHNNKLAVPSKSKGEDISWRNGEFFFENASLSDVLYTLSLQYDINVRVEIPDPSSRYYTGYFTNHNLKEALDLICSPLSLNYQMLGTSEVKISSKNNLTNKPKSK